MATVIQLDPALDEAVQAFMRDGDFDSPTAVLREAMRALQRQHFHAAIDAGIAELDAGLGVPMEDARTRLLERYENWPAKDT